MNLQSGEKIFATSYVTIVDYLRSYSGEEVHRNDVFLTLSYSQKVCICNSNNEKLCDSILGNGGCSVFQSLCVCIRFELLTHSACIFCTIDVPKGDLCSLQTYPYATLLLYCHLHTRTNTHTPDSFAHSLSPGGCFRCLHGRCSADNRL